MELSPCRELSAVTGVEFAHSCQEFNANGPCFLRVRLNTDILDDGHCLDLCLSSISPRLITASLRPNARPAVQVVESPIDQAMAGFSDDVHCREGSMNGGEIK
jgi:hypothetical protein